VHNYTCYGAEVLAVADGKVVGIRNDLDEQKPGKLPDPDTVTIDTVNGNHVVVDIRGGYFAFYAHLQKNSVTLRVGDQVKKGAVFREVGKFGEHLRAASPLSHHDGPVCSRLERRSLCNRLFQSCRTNRYRGIRGRARSHRELGKRTPEQSRAS
jgi:Peptidase family M23